MYDFPCHTGICNFSLSQKGMPTYSTVLFGFSLEAMLLGGSYQGPLAATSTCQAVHPGTAGVSITRMLVASTPWQPLPWHAAACGHCLSSAAAANSVGNMPTARHLHAAGFPPNLEFANFGSNNFTGSLPDALPDKLVSLRAGRNNLTGQLPALPSTASLQELDLSRNSLTGPLPASLIDGRSPIFIIDLHGNRLSGGLGGSTGFSSSNSSGAASRHGRKMQQGPVWTALSNLTHLDLSQNELTGVALNVHASCLVRTFEVLTACQCVPHSASSSSTCIWAPVVNYLGFQ